MPSVKAVADACWAELQVPDVDDTNAIVSFLRRFACQIGDMRRALRRFRIACASRGQIQQDGCKRLACALAVAQEEGLLFVELTEHESNMHAQCPECGKSFSSNSAMGSWCRI